MRGCPRDAKMMLCPSILNLRLLWKKGTPTLTLGGAYARPHSRGVAVIYRVYFTPRALRQGGVIPTPHPVEAFRAPASLSWVLILLFSAVATITISAS